METRLLMNVHVLLQARLEPFFTPSSIYRIITKIHQKVPCRLRIRSASQVRSHLQSFVSGSFIVRCRLSERRHSALRVRFAFRVVTSSRRVPPPSRLPRTEINSQKSLQYRDCTAQFCSLLSPSSRLKIAASINPQQ